MPAPLAELQCSVVVPVRDEAARLVDALAALATQVGIDGLPLDRRCFEILVLANNCSDDSAAVARAFARRHPRLRLHVVDVQLPPHQSNVGFARRELMNAACERLRAVGSGEGYGNGVIVSTDGDSRVERDWLARTLLEIVAGADAVGGRILTNAQPALPPHALRLKRLDEAYSLLRIRLRDLVDPDPFDRWPSHHQHFGASLAVTARAYCRVGGMPLVEFLEDQALVEALARAGCRVRRSPDVRVRTSARLDGRAAVGLAWQFRQWAHAPVGYEPTVEHPADFLASLERRRDRADVGPGWPITGDPAQARVLPVSAAVAMLRRMVAARRLATTSGQPA